MLTMKECLSGNYFYGFINSDPHNIPGHNLIAARVHKNIAPLFRHHNSLWIIILLPCTQPHTRRLDQAGMFGWCSSGQAPSKRDRDDV
eukprot:scaffold4390_cov71-Skeletonema_dohrnii-CCMP3373.AAC.8